MNPIEKIFSELSFVEKNLYLGGIYCLAHVDGEYSKKEISLFHLLVDKLKFYEKIDCPTDFDLEFTEALFNFLRDSKVKVNFLLDCALMMTVDGSISNNERHLFSTYVQLLGFSEKTQSEIASIPDLLLSKNKDVLVEIFTNCGFDASPDVFQYCGIEFF